MGKISEYDKVNKLSASDTFILEGADGTKGITTNDLVYAALDASIPVEMRRNIFRGKNLGSVYTDAQKSEVRAGTFKDLFLGDYWEITGRVWRIVDINYWLGSGNVHCETYHLVIMPDKYLYYTQMNETDITEGGYVGSKMYTENLENAKTLVNSAFGENNILNHKELLNNSAHNGAPVGSIWLDSTVELPNENMIYGSYITCPMSNGQISSQNSTISNTQLSLMSVYPMFITPSMYNYWLRDVHKSDCFAGVDSSRSSYFFKSSASRGVRPVFGLIG